MSENRQKLVYVGRRPCGCIRAAHVADTSHPGDLGKFLRDMDRSRLRVELLPLEQCRQISEWKCFEHSAVQGSLL